MLPQMSFLRRGTMWRCLWLMLVTLAACMNVYADAIVSGELKKWHKITITFDGPDTGEAARPNVFRDYRLDVTFTKGGTSHTVPGYYAADGNAAETSAARGNKWRVHFLPDEEGVWTYTVSFWTGTDVAIRPDPKIGGPTSFHGSSGTFTVEPTDKTGRDHRAKGLLRYVGERYLQFAETNEYFIKGGADSPENFLAYVDFDGTYFGGESPKREGEADHNVRLHRYEAHAKDWTPGDPVWKGDRGKNIIGALNYLARKGMNSVYFLTMNVGGDGKDVWPWTSDDERSLFDCSKLDQWELVFSYMDQLGILLHVITQETENDQLLDGGALGPERKLYYRELIARFGHHPALVWNLGEENTNTDEERKAFCKYIHELDPYDHPIVVHTYPGNYDKVYAPLLGYAHFYGPSLQMGDMSKTHSETIKWIDRSSKSGRQWVVCLDEIGPADTGVKPDRDDFWHDQVRKQPLWGNLMAGGAGCEWYFGYKFAHNDLNCDDWRSRDHLWDLTRYALEFFQKYLPFTEMDHHDELTSSSTDYCFAKPGEIYAIYLPEGGTTKLKIQGGTYTVMWYNPREGGALQKGTVFEISGPGNPSIGDPPGEREKDWVALVRKRN